MRVSEASVLYIIWLANLDKDSCRLIRNLRFMSRLFQKLVNVSLDSTECTFQLFLAFFGVPRYHSWDHQTQQNAHTHAFLGPIVLFTPLKIILL